MKLYVQLQPNDEGLAYVQSVQQTLPNGQARLVQQAAMHLTVVHIGAVDKVIIAMRDFTNMNSQQILAQIDILIQQLQAITATYSSQSFTLQSTGYDRFGIHGSTCVITFESSAEIGALYSQSLAALKLFFVACNVQNVDSFMAQDQNFQYALSLRPHLAIAKSHVDTLPTAVLQAVSFKLMPVVYDV